MLLLIEMRFAEVLGKAGPQVFGFVEHRPAVKQIDTHTGVWFSEYSITELTLKTPGHKQAYLYTALIYTTHSHTQRRQREQTRA